MKNIIKLCLLLGFVVYYSCDDPYKDTVYQVYDVQPAGSYLQNRSNDFSEWIKILKYGDLFNAINRADDAFTVLAPTNDAVQRFYEKKNISSIEELGREYARTLAKYHIINDSIDQEEFVKGGELPGRTLSGDALQITFDDNTVEGGLSSVFVNQEAHVSEFAITTANGRIYVLDDVLNPAIETIYERLSTKTDHKIFCQALERTGWRDTLNIVTSLLSGPSGMQVEQKRNFTVLSVSDEVFAGDGISSFDDLVAKLNAGSDYENRENALNSYIAYHILNGARTLSDFQAYDNILEKKKLWGTRADSLILASEVNQICYLNDDGNGAGVTFVTEKANELVKNGYIQPVDGYLPIVSQEPVAFAFDFCDFPEIAAYVAAYGKAQPYQQRSRDESEEYTNLAKLVGRTDIVSQVECYQMTLGPSGAKTSEWNYLQYGIARGSETYDWWKLLNYDMLVINIGYNGTLTMTTPVILKGKYKVTLFFAYEPTMKFMGERANNSNGGLTAFSFDGSNSSSKSSSKRVYDGKKDDTNHTYESITLFDAIEFDKTQSHSLKLTIQDPTASTNANFRLMLDYLLFEPVN